MTKKKKSSRSKNKRQQQQQQQQRGASGELGFVAAAAPGCHVIHDDGSAMPAPWIIGAERFDAAVFGCEQVPELSFDWEERLLTFVNQTPELLSFYVSVAHRCLDASNQPLECAYSCNEHGERQLMTTFIVVLRPKRVIDVCFVELSEQSALDGSELRVWSDVVPLAHAPPRIEHLLQATTASSSTSSSSCESSATVAAAAAAADIRGRAAVQLGFPLGGAGPFLCSQGFGGRFTHFFPGTLYAIDLNCPIGTPVVAVGDGVVTQLTTNSNLASGIDIRNLFLWNSITIRLDASGVDEAGAQVPVFVEYVHIEGGSAVVAVGERVAAGQQLCRSGQAGFCPVPHLHLQVHDDSSPKAPTVPYCFASCDPATEPFVPIAGRWYSRRGEEPAPEKSEPS